MLLLPSLLPTCYPHSSTVLPTSPFFWRKVYPLPFFGEKTELQYPSPL